MRAVLAACLAALATTAAAIELAPPGARLTASEGPIADSVILPRTAFSPDRPAEAVSGSVTRRAWRLPGRSDTPLQFAAPLEAQLQAEGFDIVFTCSDQSCGGFDFRFQLSLLPAPGMFVDLGNYRYVLAEKRGPDGPYTVSIVTSRAGDAGTLHVTEVSPLAAAEAEAVTPELARDDRTQPGPALAASENPSDRDDVVALMESAGHVVLSEIDFPSGASSLPDGDYRVLSRLARWMEDTPEARIVLVGHTDAVGSLAANTDLSRRRAVSVASYISTLAPSAADRISAAGAGYLSPVASNLTEEGRAANRRVEVVLLSR